MHDEPPPRKLKERTGKHFCVHCLVETEAEEFFRNDHICDKCAEKENEERAPSDESPSSTTG